MSFTNLFFMVIVMIFERIIENRQIAPENGCIYDRPKNRENDDENNKKMNDPKSIESLGFGLASLGRVWCRCMRKDALRVLPAVTRLTVYRRLRVLIYFLKIIIFIF